nr:amidohydrolase family protein [Clostridia bacterium]
MYYLIIKNGIVIDGTASPRYHADIAVKDGKIAKIAPSITAEAKREIDATGLIVSPGFIDAHTHSDSALLSSKTTGYNHLEDGATTEICGQCGSFPAPAYDRGYNNYAISKSEWMEVCKSYTSYFKYIENVKHGPNHAFFAGQSPIRGKVMGYGYGTPNAEQTQQMRDLMSEAMECGALGFSTGLVYTPSVYATTEELVEIAKVAASYGGVYTSHVRGEGDFLLDSVKEALHIGREANIPVNISHIKVMGKHNVGLSLKVIEHIEQNIAAGMKITADQYPYLAGWAGLSSQLPPKYLTNGHLDGVKKLLADPELKKQCLEDIMTKPEEFESSFRSAGFEGCQIVSALKTKEHIGKDLQQLADEWGMEPFDATLKLLEMNDSTVGAIYFTQNKEDMLNFLARPWVMAGSDISDYAEPKPEETARGGHPRGMATMVHRLELIRDNGLWSLEDAIYRMTGKTAETYSLPGIGKLLEGMNADITIFDYAALRANTDYEFPFKRNSGIEYVVVNGDVAVESGRFNGTMSGKFIKKAR